jgi:hypothetical protein
MDALLIMVHLVVVIAYLVLGQYATEWALVRGTLRLGSSEVERTHANSKIEWAKWDFGPTSVISCYN